MPIELKMPALSPTMEEGTLAKWLVKVGDTVKSGDLLAEIETDKATMEFESVDDGTIAEIVIAEGTDGVKVGTVIARINGEGEAAPDSVAPAKAGAASGLSGGVETAPQPTAAPASAGATRAETTGPEERGYGANPVEDAEVAQVEAAAKAAPAAPPPAPVPEGDRIIASPLARRIAAQSGVDLATITGSGPNGRIVKADVEAAGTTKPLRLPEPVEGLPSPPPAQEGQGFDKLSQSAPAAGKPAFATDIPHEAVKLSNIRKTIARRLTESKATIPHIYLTLDVRLDALLKLRADLNAALAARDIKLSVNDLLVKALALALIEVPVCNVSYQGDILVKYARADISVAVSTPTGLITPIVMGADTKSLSAISVEVKDLAVRARDGKLKPEEYQGGTASISNMGMYGITQFDAVINPPQAMILAVGAGERRPVVDGDAVGIATVMSATGSFDHRAIDGSDGAALMKAFKGLCEMPLGLVA